jgi:hypothetical protein
MDETLEVSSSGCAPARACLLGTAVGQALGNVGCARDGGESGNRDVGCAGLIAGKPAPTGLAAFANTVNTPNHCGSEPARDGGESGNRDVGCAGLIASKPAPTGLAAFANTVNTPNHCGSEPARDGGESGNRDVGCAGLIASKPAPTAIQAFIQARTAIRQTRAISLARSASNRGASVQACSSVIGPLVNANAASMPCSYSAW